MNSQYIRLGQALDQMDQVDENGKPVPFQIKFVTANRQSKSGGEIVELKSAVKCDGQRNGQMVVDHREKPASSSGKPTPKDPNHWVNATRNILLPNGQIRKIHLRLIIEFCHKKVCY